MVKNKKQFADQPPGEIARFLESLPIKARLETWDQIPEDIKSKILPFLHEQVKSSLIQNMSSEEIISVAENMRPSGVANLID